MSDNLPRARRQLDGSRNAVRQHIEKFRRYTSDDDRRFALKTIRNAQDQIGKLRRRNPTLPASWEDTWRP